MDEGSQIRATVVTVSDEIHSGKDANRAGPLALDLLAAYGVRAELVVVPDDLELIRSAVATAISSGARMVLTCGGTGIGPGDVTVDAVTPLLAYQVPGISEEIRRRGAIHVASALVSREVAGVVLDAPAPVFVITAPGSRGGVRDAIDVVGPHRGPTGRCRALLSRQPTQWAWTGAGSRRPRRLSASPRARAAVTTRSHRPRA